jgi:hypothetical protein
LPQHKGNERIGEAQKPFRCALPIVTEIALLITLLTQNGNMYNNVQIQNSKFKIMPSAIVRGQYPMIGAILDPL